MNGFDNAILTYMTQHASRSGFINHAIRDLTLFYTVKGLVLMSIICWMWFASGKRNGKWQLEMVIAIVVSGLVALIAGRLLAHYLPYRTRPIHEAGLHLNFPDASYTEPVLRFWSSFPSDHAMLWGAIATGIFLVYRIVGLLALLYTIVFILLPRVYLGLHYPTDVMAGLVLGMAFAWLMTRDAIRVRIAAPVLRAFERWPAFCYTFAFVLCFELITQFDEIRIVSSAIRKAVMGDLA